MKALIAEHDAELLTALEARLSSWGFRPLTARNGEEARRALRRDGLSLVVCDNDLPGAPGPRLCRWVRETEGGSYVYLVVLVREEQRDGIPAALAAGADDCTALPPRWPELEARLQAARRRIRLQQHLLDTHRRLLQMSTRDSLTKLWNRRAILRILHNEFSRHSRQEEPLSVAMLDLDRFKRVNDELGHAAGDEVLRESALRMKAVLRLYDSLGRYGGEEFLLIVPGCATDHARGIAERLCRAVSERPMATPNGPVSITLSGGVAACGQLSADTPDALLQAADMALYRAKGDGRNCVRTTDALRAVDGEEGRDLLLPSTQAAPGPGR